jgi:modulator of FtsH protease HflC
MAVHQRRFHIRNLELEVEHQDPNRFVATVGDATAAEMRLHDIIWSGLSATLGSRDLESVVGTEPEKGRDRLPARSTHRLLTDRAALEQYGINVVDVRIKRLNLPEQNKQSVYARMRAERQRIARQYRSAKETPIG